MRVAVIGTGTMGAGIAQVCALAGHPTALHDEDPAQVERASVAIDASLDKLVARRGLEPGIADAARAALEPCSSLAAAVAEADVVVESVVEVLAVKQEVLAAVDAAAPPGALIGTNTSQLSITALATACPARAADVVGLHFFNPPVLMPLVEVVVGDRTSAATVERAVALATGLGKETVVCRKDVAGFLTSRVSAIVRIECLKMLEEGVASASEIDKALRLGLNWPMGPLELGDLNGLDTFLHIVGSLEEAHGDRFRAPEVLRDLVAAGHVGRKAGRGIYRYDEEGRRVPDDAPAGIDKKNKVR